MSWKLRLGTRSSLLAMTQATLAQKEIEILGRRTFEKGVCIELKNYTTSGDRLFDARLESFGGKGLFVKEIECALLNKEIDIAIHSAKDLPVQMTPGLVFAAFLEREDPRDVLITRTPQSLADLPRGAHIGTSSLRRKVQLQRLRADLNVVHFRGNIDTRLKKLEDGVVSATLLALAGLKRINRWSSNFKILSTEDMLPAAGQGALVLQCRYDDHELYSFLRLLNHPITEKAVLSERSFLSALSGSCNMPIAGYASIDSKGLLHLRAMVSTREGDQIEYAEASGMCDAAERIGSQLGFELKPFVDRWRACGSL